MPRSTQIHSNTLKQCWPAPHLAARCREAVHALGVCRSAAGSEQRRCGAAGTALQTCPADCDIFPVWQGESTGNTGQLGRPKLQTCRSASPQPSALPVTPAPGCSWLLSHISGPQKLCWCLCWGRATCSCSVVAKHEHHHKCNMLHCCMQHQACHVPKLPAFSVSSIEKVVYAGASVEVRATRRACPIRCAVTLAARRFGSHVMHLVACSSLKHCRWTRSSKGQQFAPPTHTLLRQGLRASHVLNRVLAGTPGKMGGIFSCNSSFVAVQLGERFTLLTDAHFRPCTGLHGRVLPGLCAEKP